MTGPPVKKSRVGRQRAAAWLALVLLAVAAVLFPVVFSSPVAARCLLMVSITASSLGPHRLPPEESGRADH